MYILENNMTLTIKSPSTIHENRNSLYPRKHIPILIHHNKRLFPLTHRRLRYHTLRIPTKRHLPSPSNPQSLHRTPSPLRRNRRPKKNLVRARIANILPPIKSAH